MTSKSPSKICGKCHNALSTFVVVQSNLEIMNMGDNKPPVPTKEIKDYLTIDAVVWKCTYKNFGYDKDIFVLITASL